MMVWWKKKYKNLVEEKTHEKITRKNIEIALRSVRNIQFFSRQLFSPAHLDVRGAVLFFVKKIKNKSMIISVSEEYAKT